MVESIYGQGPARSVERGAALPLLPLLAMALGSFAIGCTEFAAVALLPQIAADLGVSRGVAGQLVGLNALAVMIAAPLLSAALAKASVRSVAAYALGVFALAHIVAALSDSFVVIAATRLASGASFGLYLAVAFAAATRMACAAKRSSAMAIVQSGITTSTALGIPAGLALGRTGGDAAGWRSPFLVIAGLAIVAAIATAALLPQTPVEGATSAGVYARLGVLRRGHVILGLVTISVFWGGSFGGLTYLVAYLDDGVHLSFNAIILVLLVAGAASVVGNFAGGAAADRFPAGALTTTAAGALIGLVLLFGSDAVALVIVGLSLWQLATWSFVPIVQSRVYQLGGDQGEAAVSYAISAFNLGILTGAALGGLALDLAGFSAVGIVSAAFALAATGLAAGVNRVLAAQA